ncbi:MFS transporter [Streptomyces sulphureus]|uniref:MFS transporter n=1 Tax=Streptomyces sulphureus TaxID=47758 RepID=UPI000370BE7B|nr:MFS transporter [Streptomyces sulphureus]
MSELVIRSRRDITDFINRAPGTARTTIFAVLGLVSVFTDAYDLGSLGIGIDQMAAEWDLSSFQVGSVSAVIAIGALLSTFLGGYLADRTGRFKVFVIASAILVVTPIGSALAPNFETMLVFRFLMGVGTGLDLPVAFSLMVEFLNTRRKGTWVNLWQPLSSVATMSGALAALVVKFAGAEDQLWRWSVGIGAVPVFIVLLVRLKYAEESPMWAAQHRGLAEAGRIVERVYQVPVRVVPPSGRGAGDDSAATDAAPMRKRRRRPRTTDIFRRPFRARTTLASVIAGTQSLQYYAIGFYSPVIAGLLFGDNLNAIVLATVIVHTFALVSGVLQGAITNRMGLWRLATIGYVIVAVSLLILSALGDDGWDNMPLLPVLLVGMLMFGHAFGPGPQSKTMATLSYPTEYRSLGSGWAETMGRIGSILGLFLFPVLLDTVGQSLTMLLLASAPVAALIALFCIRWEPIGQDVETGTPEQAPATEPAEPARAHNGG